MKNLIFRRIVTLVTGLFLTLLTANQSFAWEVIHSLPKYNPSEHGQCFAGGVIIYSVVRNRPYILLGQEQGGSGEGTWCMMLGLTDGNTTIVGAAREMHEESGGVYEIDPRDLSKFPYMHLGEGIFIVPGEYVEESVFNRSASDHPVACFREMNHYVWVDLQDLRHALQKKKKTFSTQTPTDRSVTVTLRSCAKKIFLNAEADGFLAAIPHGIQAGPMWAQTPDVKFIHSCYRQYLNRNAEPNGCNFWVNHCQTSGRESAKNGIAESNEAFVQHCYRKYLGRWAETEGLNYWCNSLNSQSRACVENSISDSPESRARR